MKKYEEFWGQGGLVKREETYVGQRILAMVPPGKRRKGRPQRWYVDNIRGCERVMCQGDRHPRQKELRDP